MKKIIAVLVLLIGLIAAALAWQAIEFLSSPAQIRGEEVVFEVTYGMPFSRVAKNLKDQGLIRDTNKFRWLARFSGKTTQIKVGEYRLRTDSKPREILAALTTGESISYSLTIPEGHNIFDIRLQLNQMWPGRGEEFYKIVTDKNFIQQMTGLGLKSLEGYLFPETYVLTKYTPTKALVRHMYENFKKNIEEANRDSKIKMNLQDHVTLASVIEKETGAPSERQLISSVFHNRLKKGMRLQSDPTIIYGMMVETGLPVKNITKKDILRATPYNTYTVRALPAGPIANPGRQALWAAVNPAESSYLYFVSRNDGTHVFSETYEQHNRAVRKFQMDRKMREGKSWRDLQKKTER